MGSLGPTCVRGRPRHRAPGDAVLRHYSRGGRARACIAPTHSHGHGSSWPLHSWFGESVGSLGIHSQTYAGSVPERDGSHISRECVAITNFLIGIYVCRYVGNRCQLILNLRLYFWMGEIRDISVTDHMKGTAAVSISQHALKKELLVMYPSFTWQGARNECRCRCASAGSWRAGRFSVESLSEGQEARKESRSSKWMMNGREVSNCATTTMCRLLLYAILWYLSIVAVSGDNIETSKSTTASPSGTHAVAFSHRLYKTDI